MDVKSKERKTKKTYLLSPILVPPVPHQYPLVADHPSFTDFSTRAAYKRISTTVLEFGIMFRVSLHGIENKKGLQFRRRVHFHALSGCRHPVRSHPLRSKRSAHLREENRPWTTFCFDAGDAMY